MALHVHNLHAQWDRLCDQLGYNSPIRSGGWQILQQLATKDSLSDPGVQARTLPRLRA